MSSATTLDDDRTIAAQMDKISFCTFVDHNFKKGVKSQYTVQCIHQSCVLKVDRVLFTVASNQNIIYMLLIKFSPVDL